MFKINCILASLWQIVSSELEVPIDDVVPTSETFGKMHD